MIQTLNTISLILALLAVVLLVVSLMIFFNWNIREVRGFLTGKTKADALANLRGETDVVKRYSLGNSSLSSREGQVERKARHAGETENSNEREEIEIEPMTTEFTCLLGEDEDE